MGKSIKLLVEIISKNKKFLEHAIRHEGLGETYLLFKGTNENIDPHEKKRLLENLARIWISENDIYVDKISHFFEYNDLIKIKKKIVGKGKIGGKSAGMLLAYNILKKNREYLDFDFEIPKSWYIGSDVFVDFMYRSNIGPKLDNLKYQEDILAHEYYEIKNNVLPQINFNEKIINRITKILKKTHGTPLVIRSSSLLEDNFGTPFAGKYDSYFISNQFSIEENLKHFVAAMKDIYLSVFHPDSIAYRKKKNLLDSYEAMGLLVQKVIGKKIIIKDNEYYFPLYSGVGFSQNDYAWNKDVKKEDGVVRLALGLGTAVVDTTTKEKVYILGLSKFSSPFNEKDLQHAQKTVHLIDLKEKDHRETVKKFVIEDIKDQIKDYNGFEDLITVSDMKGVLRQATKYNISSGYPFITFHSISDVWAERLKKVLKVIEFNYARRDLINHLNRSKWDIVGKIIKYCPFEIQHRLEQDHLDTFDPIIIQKYLKDYPDKVTYIIKELKYVVSAKRMLANIENYATFIELLKDISSQFLKRDIYKILAKHAVDIEFAVINNKFHILQCRPLNLYINNELQRVIEHIPKEKVFIDAKFPSPTTQIDNIKYVIFVDDKKYHQLSIKERYTLKDVIGDLNSKYKKQSFILIVPGRAGSSQPELGVPFGYKDINNTKLLIEYPLEAYLPEFSYGSHFFLDLVGDNIYTFCIQQDDVFNKTEIYDNVVESFHDGTILVSQINLSVYMNGLEKRIISEIRD